VYHKEGFLATAYPGSQEIDQFEVLGLSHKNAWFKFVLANGHSSKSRDTTGDEGVMKRVTLQWARGQGDHYYTHQHREPVTECKLPHQSFPHLRGGEKKLPVNNKQTRAMPSNSPSKQEAGIGGSMQASKQASKHCNSRRYRMNEKWKLHDRTTGTVYIPINVAYTVRTFVFVLRPPL
jgi:hypothetical protein